jgi:predicted ester cyclase
MNLSIEYFKKIITGLLEESLERRMTSSMQFDDFNNVVEAMIASEAYPDLVGTYRKASLTPKAVSSENQQAKKIINFRGVSIYRIQNGKMVETWHVTDGLPSKI